MMRTDLLSPAFDQLTANVFGEPDDPIMLVAIRAEKLMGRYDPIVWEGDAATFAFTFVSPNAEAILGHPPERWMREPTFWADVVLHPEDRNEAIAYCALATGQCRDHDFVYRAVAADGRIVTLHDIVRVVRGPRGLATHLRGIMVRLDEGLPGEAEPVA